MSSCARWTCLGLASAGKTRVRFPEYVIFNIKIIQERWREEGRGEQEADEIVEKHRATRFLEDFLPPLITNVLCALRSRKQEENEHEERDYKRILTAANVTSPLSSAYPRMITRLLWDRRAQPEYPQRTKTREPKGNALKAVVVRTPSPPPSIIIG